MYEIKTKLLFLTLFSLIASTVVAQNESPEINPTVTYKTIDDEGNSKEETSDAFSGNAPADAVFAVNPSNTDGWTCSYEWVITRESTTSTEEEALLDRYMGDEDEMQYTFNESGTFKIVCNATFINGNDTIRKTEDDWHATCTIYESELVMPNFFSPNGDSANDFYKPKKHKSIIEFHAKIFNRWGQKLYEWDDVNGEGWDGSYKGHQVKDGVYFCLVHAKGADGHKFTIRKDVNILRSVDESYESGSSEQ